MSLIRTKFTENETFQSFDQDSINENTNPALLKRLLKQGKQFTPGKSNLGINKKNDLLQFSPILKNLKQREAFVQTHNFKKARNLKEKLVDPKKLKDEYEKLVERYKCVRFRDTMRPRKMPRSGINICMDEKRMKYQVITNDYEICE